MSHFTSLTFHPLRWADLLQGAEVYISEMINVNIKSHFLFLKPLLESMLPVVNLWKLPEGEVDSLPWLCGEWVTRWGWEAASGWTERVVGRGALRLFSWVGNLALLGCGKHDLSPQCSHFSLGTSQSSRAQKPGEQPQWDKCHFSSRGTCCLPSAQGSA